MKVPRILIIAGSDSGGGAGIQADIKTVTMLGGFAATAITAITAQNSLGVTAVHPVPADMVLSQIDAVASDIGVDAVKIGMIGSPSTASAVADRLSRLQGVQIVFDPVMVATSGAVLADGATVDAFGRLMQLSTLITPNAPELAVLAEKGADSLEALEAAARAIVDNHGVAVLAKGGHLEGPTVTDLLVAPGRPTESWCLPRIDTRHSHGTGCTLASAVATALGHGHGLSAAITMAREYVRMAMLAAPGFGSGHGPMGHGQANVTSAMTLNHVMVPAQDYAASVAFYRLLGLTQIVDSPPLYARFESPGGATFSIHAGGSSASASVVYFESPDLDCWVDRLSNAGVDVVQGPTDQPWLWREARLHDPAGNEICLYRAGTNRRFPPWRMAPEDSVG